MVTATIQWRSLRSGRMALNVVGLSPSLVSTVQADTDSADVLRFLEDPRASSKFQPSCSGFGWLVGGKQQYQRKTVRNCASQEKLERSKNISRTKLDL
ncbi:hypothetical protein V6N11_015900 [Hibiscus sabdariffa]|uniref:Secreted protein n=1 Tax=Hibiscus sabdariffa TaxID=183260 RepID=A0ABR2TTT1_9ROSI